MRIAVIGGGPGGLYFAALAKRLDPARDVTVWERKAAGETYGFGVVFSDETLGGISRADPEVFAAMAASFARWDDIDIHVKNRVVTSGGHGFAAMSRVALREILASRCRSLGVDVRLRSPAPPPERLAGRYDLIVAADGAHSAVRSAHAGWFGTQVTRHRSRYIWLGTPKVFEAFTFCIRQTPHGVIQAHAYPYGADASTFIVEASEAAWRAWAPGESEADAIAACEKAFADLLDGAPLTGRDSRWLTFATVRNTTWHHRLGGAYLVLLGDAAHTAHFSIGSGTKLAMEDALTLAACLSERDDPADALTAYQAERLPVVLSTQRAAAASLAWFEEIAQYTHQAPLLFAFNLLTRSRRVTYDNLRLRDPEFTGAVHRWFAASQAVIVGAAAGATEDPPPPPMFTPWRLRGLTMKNRVIVSPMDMYSSADGTPGDFHLVHLGSLALGGAGLVLTEMVCVSPHGRITPGCAGLYAPEHAAAWRRIVDFVHAHTTAAIGLQIGHSGRKGSTRLMWEGMDEPLPDGNWEVVGPSPLPYRGGVSQVPRELTPDDLAEIRAQFVRAARLGERAGFDLLELHCAHGYLLSSFISPVSNQRTDRYGGSLAGRLRFPLAVFADVRAAWPAHKPLTVRISATDWVPGGLTDAEAVAVARAFADAGADAIDVSTGQVTPAEQPAFGRSYQTPFADRIRNRAHVATIAVGAISSYDDVNSIILAGRADACAIGRPHLYDPQWTLHAAADQGYSGPGADWPAPLRAGSRKPPAGRVDDPRPRLDLLTPGGRAGSGQQTRHQRWRPGTRETG